MAPASASLGIAFGILASTAGMGLVAPDRHVRDDRSQARLSSAAASVLDDGGSIAAAVIAAVLLNARYSRSSIADLARLRGSRTRRFLESQLIVDESWAVAQRGWGRIDRRDPRRSRAPALPVLVGATALGVFGSGFSDKPERFGLDAAFRRSSSPCSSRS